MAQAEADRPHDENRVNAESRADMIETIPWWKTRQTSTSRMECVAKENYPGGPCSGRKT